MEKPSIVFVDDQGNILQSFRRSLRSLEDTWDIRYAGGGSEALKILGSTHVDIIVSDTNMPGMRGTELLREVRMQYPDVIRLVLSGGGRNEDVALLLRTSHQFFTKPFNLETLKGMIDRLLTLRAAVNNRDVRAIVTGLSGLPCAPYVCSAFEAELSSSAPDIDKMASCVAEDPGLAAKMLQALNSTFFGISKVNLHPYNAVQMMGPGTISFLFSEGALFQPIKTDHPLHDFLRDVYKRSLYCAHLAHEIAVAENVQDHEAAYTTGLLSEIGTIILAHEMPEVYAKLIPLFKAGNRIEVENRAMGVNHASVGAYFLGLWGFPLAVIEAVGRASVPESTAEEPLDLATVIHAADAFARAKSAAEVESLISPSVLENLKRRGCLQKWQDINSQVSAMDIWKNWQFS